MIIIKELTGYAALLMQHGILIRYLKLLKLNYAFLMEKICLLHIIKMLLSINGFNF